MRASITPQRYSVLDTFRFLAAFGVVLFHYCEFLGIEKSVHSVISLNYRHLVDFFFILSGFVIMNTYSEMTLQFRDVALYVIKRFARLYPLHLATLLFFVAYGLSKQQFLHVSDPRFDLGALPANLLMVHAWDMSPRMTFNFPSWSISAEWFSYLLFPLLLIFARRWGTGFLLSLAAGLAAVFTMQDIVQSRQSWTLATYDWGALRALPSFIVGMAINMIVRGQAATDSLSWRTVYLIGAVTVGSLYLPLPGEVFLAIFAALIYVAARVSQKNERTWLASPALVALGDASYGIYMIHMVAAAVFFGVVFRVLPDLMIVRSALVLASIAFTTLLALASYRWFELPARNFIVSHLRVRSAA